MTIEKAELEFMQEVDGVIVQLAEDYTTSDATFYENETLLNKIKQYVQDIITYDEMIEWVEELYQTPTITENEESENY